MIGLGRGVALSVLGGLLALDRTAFLQAMVSRPLVASTLAGAILGDSELGLRCGLLLELLWLMDLPVGGSIPPEEGLAAVLAAAYASLTPGAWGLPARAAFGVLVALPFGYLGRRVDVAVRMANGGLLVRAREGGDRVRLSRLHLTGAARFFGAGVAATGVGLVVGAPAVGLVAGAVSPKVAAALEWTGALLPVVGAGAVLAALPGRVNRVLFGAGVLGGLAFHGLPGFSWRGKGRWAR